MLKIKLLIIFLLAVLVLITLFFFLNKKPTSNQIPVPSPQPSQTDPAFTPVSSLQPTTSSAPSSNQRLLKVLQVTPPATNNTELGPVQQIAFTFSENVSPDNFYYDIVPYNPTEVLVRNTPPNTLIISPYKGWNEQEITITILEKTSSINNSALETPFVYKFKAVYPKNPDLTGNKH